MRLKFIRQTVASDVMGDLTIEGVSVLPEVVGNQFNLSIRGTINDGQLLQSDISIPIEHIDGLIEVLQRTKAWVEKGKMPEGSVAAWLAYSNGMLEFPDIQYRTQLGRKRIFCADGWNISVQAGAMMYASPREDFLFEYTEVEAGFPSESEPLLLPYTELKDDTYETVYPYLPIKILQQAVDKHGGIVGVGWKDDVLPSKRTLDESKLLTEASSA